MCNLEGRGVCVVLFIWLAWVLLFVFLGVFFVIIFCNFCNNCPSFGG